MYIIRTFVIKTCFSMGCAKLSSTVHPRGLCSSSVNSNIVASGNGLSADDVSVEDSSDADVE